MYILGSFVQWWNQNPYITFTIGIVGFIGFFLGIVFYYKSRARKRISFFKRMIAIAVRTPQNINMSKLKFFYDKKEIESLFASRIAIWNAGELTVDGNDMVQSFPLSIELESPHVIYEAEITKESHAANNFILQNLSPNKCEIHFDYFDRKEGCVLRILHSGGSPKISGKIKGLKTISQATVLRGDSKKDKRSNIIVVIFAVISGTLVIFYHRPELLVFPLLFCAPVIAGLLFKKMPTDLDQDFWT